MNQQNTTVTSFCNVCTLLRQELTHWSRLPWNTLIDIYEFMITLTSFRRNIIFYSNMSVGQLKDFYCQLVSYSAAKVVAINALVAKYKERKLLRDAYVPPGELRSVLSLSLGRNIVPKHFIDKCLDACVWRNYEHMVISCFAATESVRASVLKYTTIMRAHADTCVPDGFSVFVATAITGWMATLDARECLCGTWTQVLRMLSCDAEDTETSLTLQNTSRVSAYICELMDVNLETKQHVPDACTNIDYAYVFRGLIVPGLNNEPYH